jgi:phage gpG-like protein
VLTVRGVDELRAALEQMAVRIQVATPRAVVAGADELKTATRAKLELKSHAWGTPTPSAPGEPPAMISGALRDSVRYDPPRQTQPGLWMTTLGATTVYARIQELGGWAGRNHASYLPPRPYLKPAAEETMLDPAFRVAFAKLWAEAIKP